MPKSLSSRPVFKDLNHTELWQMAQRIGIPGASAAVPRDILIQALENLEEIPAPNPTERERTRMSMYLTQNIERLRSQFQKDHCPNCHASFDMEFADCWLDNQHKVS